MRNRAVVSLAVLALTAAACGSSGGGSQPIPTPPEITLGPPSTTISAPSSATAGGRAASVEQPCSFVTAAEMSGILGASATVQDEGFRCKYLVGDGWLEVELMDFASTPAGDIWHYDKAHGTPTAGIGDEAYIFGAAIVVKLGDVLASVDGNNLPQPPGDATLTVIATKIADQIP